MSNGMLEHRNGDSKVYNTFDETNDLNGNYDDPNGGSNGSNKPVDDRLIKLGLIALTTPGVKFFKSAQSSFQEYLMNDPNIRMSATTYGFMLTLISMPIVPLVGGALLDCNHVPNNNSSNNNDDSENDTTDHRPQQQQQQQQQPSEADDDEESATRHHIRRYSSGNLVLSIRSITGSVRNEPLAESVQPSRSSAVAAAQSQSFVWFLAVAVLGIFVYGLGLASPWITHDSHNSDLAIPIGLAGATIFGIGEGCVMVAARAFVGHIFLGGDGAFAQGVLIASNNLSMMASKNLVPWLIETEKQKQARLTGVYDSDKDTTSIRIGVLACLAVQFAGLLAGMLYTRVCIGDASTEARKQRHTRKAHETSEHQSLLLESQDEPAMEQPSVSSIKEQRDKELLRIREQEDDDECTPSGIRRIAMVTNLPLTFWIVASGRAIFLVTFKVFSRYSNSFLIEKLSIDAVRAGRLSSVNELFALFSPLVGFLAYRSPGGIVVFAIGAAVLGALSIASLALLPAEGILGLPGGLLSPLVGISIAHGIIIPISLAMIPHTVSPKQLGMAFAVFEVLGNTLNLTDIVFGWLRDLSGNYDAAMKLLLVYAIVGTCLLWFSRERIGSIGIGASSSRRRH